jgi:hypothetical protein
MLILDGIFRPQGSGYDISLQFTSATSAEEEQTVNI